MSLLYIAFVEEINYVMLCYVLKGKDFENYLAMEKMCIF